MTEIRSLVGYNLTCDDIARKLGYHPQYVRYLASHGKLPGIKRIRQWLFNEQEVLEFLRAKSPKVNCDTHSERNTAEPDILS